MKKVFLLLLLFLAAYQTIAHELHFENSWVLLEGGQREESPLYYDEASDRLIVQREGVEHEFLPKHVISFYFGGFEYYSLPFNGGYSFFKVLYEGSNYAVLYKPAGNKLLEYFAEASGGTIQLCEDAQNPDRLLLCEGSIGPSFGMPAYSGGAVQYELHDAVFLAVAGDMHLLSYRYQTEGQWFAGEPSLHKKNKRTLRRIKEIVKDEQKMQRLRSWVNAGNKNLEDPEQLVAAIELVYH